jgi:hypothetical protein
MSIFPSNEPIRSTPVDHAGVAAGGPEAAGDNMDDAEKFPRSQLARCEDKNDTDCEGLRRSVGQSGVVVIFKPTMSEYSFDFLADPKDIAQHGPISTTFNVRHVATGDTGNYSEREVSAMAFELARQAAK